LPKNLAASLERLEDAEVDALLAAVTAEVRRRSRLPPSSARGPAAEAKSAPRRAAADGGAGTLTTGKLKAVRAAFRAGVKPAAIARQFGISQVDVKRALAAER
jgi:DNA-binding NarL/FixJ family response regulator